MEYPHGGILGRGRRLLRRLQKMEIPSHAADASFFIVLSLFPMLVLVLSILRYTSLDPWDLMDLLDGYIPAALTEAARKLVIQTYAHTGAGVVSLSALGALWSASRGIHGILQGLNAVYDAPEDRGWLHRRTISVFYTFAFLIVLLLSLALNVFGRQILDMLPKNGGIWAFLSEIIPFRFVLTLLLQTALFDAMYAVLPNRPMGFRENIPGAVLASLGWMIFSRLFSIYVENFASLSNIYGSVYAVALSMLWLYCCLSLIFYCAAFNQYLEDHKI